jgi:putative DNA primase/helicase
MVKQCFNGQTPVRPPSDDLTACLTERPQQESRPAAEPMQSAATPSSDRAAAHHDTEQPTERQSQSVRLVALVEQGKGELFHDTNRVAYVSLETDGHVQTCLLDSQEFKEWLRYRLHATAGLIPSDQAVDDAVKTLRGKALYEGRMQEVHVRIASHDGKVYLDLGDDTWRAVEVDDHGWRLVDRPPVRFWRPRGMLDLPEPEQPSSVDEARKSLKEIRDILNVGGEDTSRLILGWLLGVFMPNGPYPILLLFGEQGAGKSTTARGLRFLVDPHSTPLRSAPNSEQDLSIAARNNRVLAFDNLSYIRPNLSDALSRISTGGGFGTRKLYSNDDEVLIAIARPVLINSIVAGLISRPDLLDRTLTVELPTIEQHRRPEGEIWPELAKARPRILGALLSALSAGLRERDRVKLVGSPRMMDFVMWVEACAEYLGWQRGDFTNAYAQQQEQSSTEAVQLWPVFQPLQDVLGRHKGEWEGTVGELLTELTGTRYGRHQAAPSDWPRSARKLSADLNRFAPALRRMGIVVKIERKGREGRKLKITSHNYALSPQSA